MRRLNASFPCEPLAFVCVSDVVNVYGISHSLSRTHTGATQPSGDMSRVSGTDYVGCTDSV